MRAALVRAAQTYVNGNPEANRPCVRTEVVDVAFEPWRVAIRGQDERAKRDRSAQVSPSGERRVAEEFDWSAEGRRLPAVEAKALARAMRVIHERAEPLPKFVRAIDPAWLPAGLKACPPNAHWRVLTFSAPTVIGDIAFVETEHICPLCGNGGSLSLRRTPSGWAPWAFRLLWIS